MHLACRIIVMGLSILCALAVGFFIIGTFGLFGSPCGPLTGVFLVSLGSLRNLMLDVFPEPLWQTLAALAPALNLTILVLICGRGARR
jgi:hypothetical protein